MISNFDWNSIVNLNADFYAENFISTLNNLYCTAFPLKTKFVKNKRHFSPWITPEIINLLKAKSDYFFLYRAGVITKNENNTFKNVVNKIVKKKYILQQGVVSQKS